MTRIRGGSNPSRLLALICDATALLQASFRLGSSKTAENVLPGFAKLPLLVFVAPLPGSRPPADSVPKQQGGKSNVQIVR